MCIRDSRTPPHPDRPRRWRWRAGCPPRSRQCRGRRPARPAGGRRSGQRRAAARRRTAGCRGGRRPGSRPVSPCPGNRRRTSPTGSVTPPRSARPRQRPTGLPAAPSARGRRPGRAALDRWWWTQLSEWSCPGAHLFTQQAGRAEDQYQDENHEGEDVLVRGPVGHVLGGEGLDQPEHEPAEHGAGDVADAPEHRGGECFEASQEADEEVDRDEAHALQHASDSGQRCPDHERNDDDPVRVDPHQRGRVRVLRRRPHGAAGTRGLDENRESDHQRDRHDDDEQRHPGDADPPQGDGAVGKQPRKRLGCLGARIEQPDRLLRTTDTPIAVISGASRGALRSGRYANRSTNTPVTTEVAIAPSRTSGRATQTLRPSDAGRAVKTVRPPNAPTMKISPWAKLISWIMPYTMVSVSY